MLRDGRQGPSPLKGPLAHWAIQSDGGILFIADEEVNANQVGASAYGVSNRHAIGVQVTGVAALNNQKQIERLVRLVADIADRWQIPTKNILSHGEVSPGRNQKCCSKPQLSDK